ncbi:MAG: LuxR C-terminal-related transcriptional regulator [Clostridiales Family XIII bacterium]|jgi:ATP/maltotriose-dependent transcriptional regulator MalT|nr:LuxR C-terminal-related transcriptional regulator [Clostridiales Family XIII bacterium]
MQNHRFHSSIPENPETRAFSEETHTPEDLRRGEMAYFKAEAGKCEQFAYQALYKARGERQHETENKALFLLLRRALWFGDYAKIQALFKQMEAQLHITEYADRHMLHDLEMGWFHAMIGCPDRIAEWLKTGPDKRAAAPAAQGHDILIRARHGLCLGKHRETLDFLAAEKGDPCVRSFVTGHITLRLLEAMCLFRAGERAGARDALRESYHMARPQALDMPFIEFGRDMCRLAGAVIRDGNGGIPQAWLEKIRKKSAAYAKQSLFVASEYSREHGGEGLAPALTRGELAILTDICHGLPRAEIAAAHGMSDHTLRAVQQILFAKLGARNHADVIRIAVSRKLVK